MTAPVARPIAVRSLGQVTALEYSSGTPARAHLVLAHDGPERIGEYLKGRIGHVHLSDCDGKVHGDLPPGRGCVPFQPYLSALQEAGFDGTVSIELEYSPEPAKIVDWVREAYTATAGFMKELGIRDAAAAR